MGFSWDFNDILMGFHRISWDFMRFHRDFMVISMGFHRISWDFMMIFMGLSMGDLIGNFMKKRNLIGSVVRLTE